MKIVIAGGGIVGLTTALSLHAAGFQPVVYEAVSNPSPLGVGINLLPHAVREFAELDMLADIESIGLAIDELVYLMADGREVWREPRGLSAGYHWPQIAVHRGALQMLLMRRVMERLGPEAIQFGHSLSALEQNADGVTAVFVNRRAGGIDVIVKAELLIGADGIHSVVRRIFYPNEGMPKWNKVTLWRSTSPSAPILGGRSMIWAGHSGQKFVAYPIRHDETTGETTINWICDLRGSAEGIPGREDWNKRAERSAFLPRFADWRWAGVDVPAIVGSSGDIFEFPMVDRDPLPRWSFGRVTLVGDAAHPMYPIGSNGATQGVIDARSISFHLATATTIHAALEGYEQMRREATSKIVLMNRMQGPDEVLDIAAGRARDRRDDLARLFPMAERAEIASAYKKIAGFDPVTFNNRPSYSVRRYTLPLRD